MTLIAQGIVLFTDDVREEVGGKSSFMGLLGPEVWVREGKSIRFVCTLLLWATDPQIAVSAEFTLENAPEGVAPPRPFTQTVMKDDDDRAEQWIVQMEGRLQFKIGNKPLIFKATFTVGGQTFTNQVIFDPLPDSEEQRTPRKSGPAG